MQHGEHISVSSWHLIPLHMSSCQHENRRYTEIGKNSDHFCGNKHNCGHILMYVLKGVVSGKEVGFNNEILILFFLKWAKQICSEIATLSVVMCMVPYKRIYEPCPGKCKYKRIFLFQMSRVTIRKLSIEKEFTGLAGTSTNRPIKHLHNFSGSWGLIYFSVVHGCRKDG